MLWNSKNSAVANVAHPSIGRTRTLALRCPKLVRGLGFVGLITWAGAAFPQGGLTAQGIFPGSPAPDAYRMPYDFEPVIRLRTFYKNTDTLTGAEQEAWVLGGFAGLRSPWFGDLFQFAVVGYTSQKLYGPTRPSLSFIVISPMHVT